MNVPAFDSPIEKGALEVVKQGLTWAKAQFYDVLIVDTAGRQQVDESLMKELAQVNEFLAPQHKFLVLDAMIGSQGLDVAKTFHEKIQLTGLVLAKLDGDARGGIALSARSVKVFRLYSRALAKNQKTLKRFTQLEWQAEF